MKLAPKVILINGKKRSGKDYTAELLCAELEKLGKTCEVMSFAQPMKTIMSITLGISEEQLDEWKNEQEMLWTCDEYGDMGEVTDCRSILQRFGTEAMKPIFGEDVWASLLYRLAAESDADFVLVPDFRFLIEDHPDAITVKVKNEEIESQAKDLHISETELDEYNFHFTIDNTGYRDITEDVTNFAYYLSELR